MRSPALAHGQSLGDDYPWRGQGTNVGFSVWHINGRPDNPATGYYWRNCTDFVADRVFRTTGLRIPRALGNAVTWGPRAQANGYRVDGAPRRGSVAWFNNSTYGHVGWVAEVRADGSILVENYNNTPGGVPNGAYFHSTHRPGAGWPAGFIHFRDLAPSPQPIRDGAFVSHGGHVYRIAGGAPLYVSTWTIFGGTQQTRALSDAEFNALRSRPRNGTFIRGKRRGEVYRVAGGAPIYVSGGHSFSEFPGMVEVDDWCIDNPGHPRAHLNNHPSNNTFLRGHRTGRVFRVAGGAPLYVSDAAAVGGISGQVDVDDWAIENAGQKISHLRRRPANGTQIAGGRRGEVYIVAGGAPIYVWEGKNVANLDHVVTIDDWAIDHPGDPAAHLSRYPADGTFIRGFRSQRIYHVKGGVPSYVTNWDAFGGPQPFTDVDQTSIDRAGHPLTHLKALSEGTTPPSGGGRPSGGGSSFGS